MENKVFAIGYVNLLASGYFLGLLLFSRSRFFDPQEREKPLTKYFYLIEQI
jgi:hypothetical protein